MRTNVNGRAMRASMSFLDLGNRTHVRDPGLAAQ
jgi:hypothetical protein